MAFRTSSWSTSVVDSVVLGKYHSLTIDIFAAGMMREGRCIISKRKNRQIDMWFLLQCRWWNRYPGAQCDIESFIYMPLLEETGYVPTEKYAHQPELLEHAERIATHYGLHEKALFQTEILSIHWEEYKGVWRIITNHNDTIYARFVVLNSGPLHRPKLPGTPGIEKFKGRAFHSSRFDYEYCGKDLSKLQDKKVAIIGTGECVSFFLLSLSL